ncbi:lead, cadmium, zinc and mercury transporting atpase [hydrocarbon metagenome]|uniref:Lead, cadmium, zinc and mercury transporting atpase n=1 Tax=hydrocarbon metagenome TaxID=938273 RepID=A0A0W8FHW9_9ZZZZ
MRPNRSRFRECITLIGIMRLGHWKEMRSLPGASRALEELIRAMFNEVHRLQNGSTEDAAGEMLSAGDRVRGSRCRSMRWRRTERPP